jgi:hypothetical protein
VASELNNEELVAILKTKCRAIADTVREFPSTPEQWKAVRRDLARLLELIKDC